MGRRIPVGLAFLAGFVVSTAVVAQEGQDVPSRIENIDKRLSAIEAKLGVGEVPSNVLNVYWKDTLHFESADGGKTFQGVIGGRIQNDWAFMTQSTRLRRVYGGFADGTEFRRARVYVKGLISGHIEFKAQYDFAGGDADFADVYMGLTKIKIGESGSGGVRIGHFKEPFSLEELTSARYIAFLERALPVIAFAPGRNTGLMLHGHCKRQNITFTGDVGVFYDTDTFGDGTNDNGVGGEYDTAARVTGTYAEDGNLLHVGAAYVYREPPSDQVRYRTYPEAHLAPYIIDTGNISSMRSHLVGIEGAVVYECIWIQSEYMHSFARRKNPTAGNRGDPDFKGFYVSGGWFLTGEKRPWKASNAVFGRVRPIKPFSIEKLKDGAIGAWELVARYSYLDLNDSGIAGGILGDLTVGLNWYLNNNLRFMFNYIWADRKAADLGHADIVLVRAQVIF